MPLPPAVWRLALSSFGISLRPYIWFGLDKDDDVSGEKKSYQIFKGALSSFDAHDWFGREPAEIPVFGSGFKETLRSRMKIIQTTLKKYISL